MTYTRLISSATVPCFKFLALFEDLYFQPRNLNMLEADELYLLRRYT